jgi:hypothetical protein
MFTVKDYLKSLNHPIRVVVTGGRRFLDREKIRWAIKGLRDEYGIERIAHRRRCGIDRIVLQEARALGIETVWYPYKKEIDGPWPACGLKRNLRMVHSEMPDLLLVFPGGNYPTTCVDEAKRLGIHIWRVVGDPVGMAPE